MGLVLVALIAVLAAGCGKEDQAPPQRKAVNVAVETIQSIAEMPDTFVIPGVVEPNRVVSVCGEVAGRIIKIYGHEGQVVRKGAKLVELNTDLLKAELDRTSSQLNISRRELERIESLHKRQPPLATDSELDVARSNAGVNQALYDAAKANFERATIVAPIDGVLNHLPKEEGEFIQPGTCIGEIVDLDPAVVVVDAPERDVATLRKGHSAEVYVGVSDDPQTAAQASAGGPAATQPRTLRGTLSYISELANAQSLTSRTELTVPNGEGTGPEGKGRALRSGQVVRVRLQRQVIHDAIMVPLGAILPLEKGYTVWVVENKKAQPRFVRVGLMKDDRIRVLPSDGQPGNGLRPGDQLIVEGQQYVGPGQDVEVRSVRAPDSPGAAESPRPIAAEGAVQPAQSKTSTR
ncbi:MAG: efflux RND transporter periplasmic adaptor subunit [Planctomycetaceae bacterium]|nr:efflux RND transporter periplasmic adaptor subunit [Planctomycetaceae bacterium]